MKVTLHNPPEGFEAEAEYRFPKKGEHFLVCRRVDTAIRDLSVDYPVLTPKKPEVKYRTPDKYDLGKMVQVRDSGEGAWIDAELVGISPKSPRTFVVFGKHSQSQLNYDCARIAIDPNERKFKRCTPKQLEWKHLDQGRYVLKDVFYLGAVNASIVTGAAGFEVGFNGYRRSSHGTLEDAKAAVQKEFDELFASMCEVDQ